MTTLLSMADVSVRYPLRGQIFQRTSGHVQALDNVSLNISAGETLGVVGESGCGKTTLGRAALGLIPLHRGRVLYRGADVAKHSRAERLAFRREAQMIFQDPYSALDPQVPIGVSIGAGLSIHRIGSRAERRARVAEVMQQVGLNPDLAGRYPHELSGGMRQRVVIARALILDPQLVICDEPTSTLDTSTQAQIINLLSALKVQFGLSLLFISHDLAIVDHVADRVAVMYMGRIIESGERDAVFGGPRHPYTQVLLASVPIADPTRRSNPPLVDRDVSCHGDVTSGCAFRAGCPAAIKICSEKPPDLLGQSDHQVACWNARV